MLGIRSNRSTLFEKHVAEVLGIRVIAIDEIKEQGIGRAVAEAIQRATDGTHRQPIRFAFTSWLLGCRHERGQAEIQDFWAQLRDHDVRQLEVAVNESSLVHCGHGLSEPADQIGHLARRCEWLIGSHQVAQ